MKKEKYLPINCNYYDELEAIATLKKKVIIDYYNLEGQKERLEEAMIKDLYTKDKEEFVVLDNGLHIRLDYLVEVDGKPVILAC